MAIEVIDKIKQKNKGKFPLMDAEDVVCKDGKSVEERLNDYGADGEDGVGIESVKQTTTSTADGGTNVITITLTNGNKSTFQVMNGSKGRDGGNGADGKSAFAYAQEGGYTGTEEEFKNMLANNLIEKFFVDGNVVLYEWDGNTEGLENISEFYYKVTDKTMTAEELLGSTAIINGLDHVELDRALIIEQSIDVHDTYISLMENGVMIVFEDTALMEGLVLTKGIWHVNPTQIGMYVAKCEKQGFKLDEKHLPKEAITELIDEYINEALGGEY